VFHFRGSTVCIYIYTLPKKSVYSSLPSSQGLTGQQGDKKVRPECDKVCSTYKVLHDPSLNQDTQGLHSFVCSIES